jgi:hypothetical protein
LCNFINFDNFIFLFSFRKIGCIFISCVQSELQCL